MTAPLRALTFTLGVCAAAGLVAADAPVDFGFSATGGPLPPTSVVGHDGADASHCEGCHAEVATEWASSMHARSFTDPVFQAELRETATAEPCRACHAPTASPALTASAAHDAGVTCAACHVRDGAVLTSRVPSRHAPHALRVVPELSSAEFCGSCHDFAFPPIPAGREIPYAAGSPQQTTLREWRRSPHAERGQTCVDCHMPTTPRAAGVTGRSHRVLSLEDPAFVRSALRVTASAHNEADGTHVQLRMEVQGAGHAVPSGDIFRELRVRVTGNAGQVERHLAREFAEQRGPHGWVLADSWDDRVQPDEPKLLELVLPTSRGAVHYDVSILRTGLDDAMRRGLPESYMVVPVASGEVRIARRASAP